MKCAILGYGKMGKEIEKVLLEKGFSVSAIIDNEEDWRIYLSDFQESDVAIDFSMPTTAVANIKKCIEYKIPVVIGTTGWLDALDEVKTLCKNAGSSLLYGSNYSIGMHHFFALCQQTAMQMKNDAGFSVLISERHHIHKKDKPSGTALSIRKKILDVCENLDFISVSSMREGEVLGEHCVRFLTDVEELELVHSVKNRAIFAKGAVEAAEWLVKNNGFYCFDDIALTMKNN